MSGWARVARGSRGAERAQGLAGSADGEGGSAARGSSEGRNRPVFRTATRSLSDICRSCSPLPKPHCLEAVGESVLHARCASGLSLQFRRTYISDHRQARLTSGPGSCVLLHTGVSQYRHRRRYQHRHATEEGNACTGSSPVLSRKDPPRPPRSPIMILRMASVPSCHAGSRRHARMSSLRRRCAAASTPRSCGSSGN